LYPKALARALMWGWYAYTRRLTALLPWVTVDGVRLVVEPGVYKPLENEQWCARFVRPGDRVLDLGCGSGIASVFAAAVAREVVAIDISHAALRNTEENCRRLGRTNVVVKHSDMFSNVDGRFDVLLANPPYLSLPMEGEEHQFATSTRYLPTLFRSAKDHLRDGGRIVLQFPAWRRSLIERLAAENGLRITSSEALPRKDLRLALYGAAYLQAGLRSTAFVLERV
jgi:release factor glutamine methyltransferase